MLKVAAKNARSLSDEFPGRVVSPRVSHAGFL
jgi:hypothetical protein